MHYSKGVNAQFEEKVDNFTFDTSYNYPAFDRSIICYRYRYFQTNDIADELAELYHPFLNRMELTVYDIRSLWIDFTCSLKTARTDKIQKIDMLFDRSTRIGLILTELFGEPRELPILQMIDLPVETI